MYRKVPIGIALILMLSGVSIGYSQEPAYQVIAVYGQADYTSNAANQGGLPSATTLHFPLGLMVDDSGGFYVADRNNNRVVYFGNDGDSSADQVYGQSGNFSSYIANFDGIGGSLPGASADSLMMPTTVAVDSTGGLYITDRDNHRVLYFANDGNTTADGVYGQFSNFSINPVNNDSIGGTGLPSAENIGVYTLGVAVDKNDDSLYISDSSNHRILYFANDGDTIADRVYGQGGNFTTGARNNGGTPSADSLSFPRGLVVDSGGGFYVADRDNNRVLYFSNDGDTTADRVYGQFGDLTKNAINNDGAGNPGLASPDSLSSPRGVALDAEGGLYVSDANNNRIVYFPNDGTTTAVWAFGQFGSLTLGVANNDGNGASGAPNEANLNGPQYVAAGSNGQVYISDTLNNRVLVVQRP